MVSIKNKRHIQILKILNNNSSIKSEELSNFVGVSSRTIRTDIKLLNDILNENGAIIASEKGIGLTLEITDKDKFAKVNADIYEKKDSISDDFDFSIHENRIDYIKSRLLFNSLRNKPITQQDLADEMFISLSTLKNSLKEVEKMLLKYDLKIISYKAKGILVYGDEFQVRYCISQHLSKYKRDVTDSFYENLFRGIELGELKQILLKNISEYDIKLTDISVNNIVIHMAIALLRSINKNFLVYTLDEVDTIEKLNEYRLANSIAQDINSSINVEMAETEICYIAQHLIASKRYLNNSKVTILKKCENLIEDIIKKIEDVIDINFYSDTQLIEGLTIHLATSINRMKFGMNIRNEVLSVIKNNYPLAFQIAIIASRVIEEKEDISINEDEIGFIALHFGAALSRKGIDDEVKFKTAIIVCSSGVGTAILIKAKIEEYFKGKIKVVNTMSGYEITNDILDNVDIVLSTVPLRNLKSDKIINVGNLLDKSEIIQIEKVVKGTSEEDSVRYEKFFRADCFYKGYSLKTKDEVLEFLTEEMISKQLISEEAKFSVFEREELSSTEIGNLVAIPHPIDNDTKTSAIAVMILDKPIMWDEQYVQIIFLISISKEQIQVWEKVFMKLFNYLTKEGGVKEIIRNQSYVKFVNSFTR